MKKLFGPIFVLILLGGGQILAKDLGQDCADLLSSQNLEFGRRYENLIESLPTAGFATSEQFKFGYESEFTLDQYAQKLLGLYAPLREMARNTWLQLNSEQRVDWVKNNLSLLFPTHRENGGLTLLPEGQKFGYLPENLILDYSGNLEIVLQPMSPMTQWQKTTAEIQQRIGNGSLQATIGLPWRDFWKENSTTSVVGMLQFFADFDALLKLNNGYRRAKENQAKPAASSFLHPYLGPLTRLKRKTMEAYVVANAKGDKMTKEDLNFVSHTDNSWKFSGTTVYRPDIAGGKYVVFEIRDAHSNLQFLTTQLKRILFFTAHGLKPFERFAQIDAFDSQGDFAQLPESVRAMLMKLFSKRFIHANEKYTDDEILANEVGRNFAYPLRDWRAWVETLGHDDLISQIRQAQRAYVSELSGVEQRLRSGAITEAQARNEIQFNLAEFSQSSGLLPAFLRSMRDLVDESVARIFIESGGPPSLLIVARHESLWKIFKFDRPRI